MTREAELAIGEAFDQETGPGTFNPLISRLTTEAYRHGMSRELILMLLLNEVAAQSGKGRRDARGTPTGTSAQAMTYQAINTQAQATKKMVEAAKRR